MEMDEILFHAEILRDQKSIASRTTTELANQECYGIEPLALGPFSLKEKA
jgi:hypothetical protein